MNHLLQGLRGVALRTVPLSCVLLLALGVAAHAQSTANPRPTYRYADKGIVSFASNTTDWITVTGSTSKSVRISNITVCGTATNASTIEMLLVRRSTADSAGSLTTPAVVPLDSTNQVAVGAVAVYTANPTLGNVVGLVDAVKLNLGPAGAAQCAVLDFGVRGGQPIILRGTTQQLAINMNGVSLPAGASLDYRIETMESSP